MTESALAELRCAASGFEAVLKQGQEPQPLIFWGFGDFRFPFPHVLTTEKVQLSKPFFRLRRAQSLVDNSGKLFEFIILDFRVDVHSYLAVFVPGQILNRLRIDACMDQVCNVGMA